jgi:hypothetical protein
MNAHTAADQRIGCAEWLVDGVGLPSGRVIRIEPDRTDDIYTIAYDEATGEVVARLQSEERVWRFIEELVREGEIG